MTPLGPIYSAARVERAVIATLRVWLPVYVSDAERQDGVEVGSTPRIPSAGFRRVNSLDAASFDEQPPPRLAAVTSRMGDIGRSQTEKFEAEWPIGIGVVFMGDSHQQARDFAQLTIAACRTLLIHKQDLGIGALSVDLVAGSETYDEAPPENERTMCAGIVGVLVTVPDVLDPWAGIPEPPDDPTLPVPDAPDVTDVFTTPVLRLDGDDAVTP